jgi:hypothetical protein
MKPLSETLARGVNGVHPEAERAKPNHDCARCSRLRDEIQRKVPGWRVPEAASWIGVAGRRVWASVCAPCAQFERDERVARAVAAGEHKDVAMRRFGVDGSVVAARAKTRLETAQAQQSMRAPAHLVEPDATTGAYAGVSAWLDDESPQPPSMSPEEFEARRLQQLEDLERRGGW